MITVGAILGAFLLSAIVIGLAVRFGTQDGPDRE